MTRRSIGVHEPFKSVVSLREALCCLPPKPALSQSVPHASRSKQIRECLTDLEISNNFDADISESVMSRERLSRKIEESRDSYEGKSHYSILHSGNDTIDAAQPD